jgi:DNA polymerase/3'-5' exonuclease PolX
MNITIDSERLVEDLTRLWYSVKTDGEVPYEIRRYVSNLEQLEQLKKEMTK